LDYSANMLIRINAKRFPK